MMLNLADLSRLATVLGGLPIPGCAVDSPAARAGLRYGDVLLARGGFATASWAEFFALGQCAATVRVWRRGVEFDVTLELPAHARCPRDLLDAPRATLTPRWEPTRPLR